MERFHKIHLIERKATWWVHMVGGETYKKTNNLSPGQCMARYVDAYVWCIETQREAKVGYRETQTRQCQTIERNILVEPNDEEFKLTIKAAPRKLEVPMPAAMPFKIPIKSSGEAHRSIGNRKTKFACVVDADESVRLRLEGAVHKHHQDHITAKGMNSLNHYNLVHKFIPMPQAMRNSGCKGSSGKRMGKTGENSGIAADDSQKQERDDRWSKEWGKRGSFRVIDGLMSLEKCWIGDKAPKNTKVELYSEVT